MRVINVMGEWRRLQEEWKEAGTVVEDMSKDPDNWDTDEDGNTDFASPLIEDSYCEARAEVVKIGAHIDLIEAQMHDYYAEICKAVEDCKWDEKTQKDLENHCNLIEEYIGEIDG